jgi:hypothetical protein
MTAFLIILLLATVWIWGVKCLFSVGYILEPAGEWIKANFPVWVYKPSIGCAACMSSIHGTLWYWAVAKLFLHDLSTIFTFAGWILFCVCLCGMNFILIESIYREEDDLVS